MKDYSFFLSIQQHLLNYKYNVDAIIYNYKYNSNHATMNVLWLSGKRVGEMSLVVWHPLDYSLVDTIHNAYAAQHIKPL